MLLTSITLRNLLSFKDATLDLQPLNVLIGPNGSGKSNFIEAIGLLHAAPTDIGRAITAGGGVHEWIWRGISRAEESLPPPVPVSRTATIACGVRMQSSPLSYMLQFAEQSQGFVIQAESLSANMLSSPDKPAVYFFERKAENVTFPGQSSRGTVSGEESIFRNYRNPADPTPITDLGRNFESLRIYREFRTGPNSQTRWGLAPGGLVRNALEDGGENLALVLQEMHFDGSLRRLIEYLSEFCERYHDVRLRSDGNVLRAYVVEEGLAQPIPAIRLSDGTLKFLCLLTILLRPTAPLICIDEPELGLHPDAVRLVARAMVEASERTQLVVTTHSEALVDELSDQPEAVVVCEYDTGSGTRFERLSKERLEGWLDRYSLGEIWRKGEIGGNRW